MISFSSITKEAFDKYAEYFISDYSKEISENYGYSLEKSTSQAKNELEYNFPNGVALPDNHLVSIELTTEGQIATIGYLWYSHSKNSDHAFICDFYIHKSYRNKGYGKASFDALENSLLESGIDQIRLRVAYKNTRAFRLYREIGFEVTGTNMIKRLKKS